MGTFLGADSALPVLVVSRTVVVGSMIAAASGANFGIVYGFDNFLGTKYFDSTVPAEWIMVRFESFDGAERTGFVIFVAPGRQVRVSVLFLSSFISDQKKNTVHSVTV